MKKTSMQNQQFWILFCVLMVSGGHIFAQTHLQIAKPIMSIFSLLFLVLIAVISLLRGLKKQKYLPSLGIGVLLAIPFGIFFHLVDKTHGVISSLLSTVVVLVFMQILYVFGRMVRAIGTLILSNNEKIKKIVTKKIVIQISKIGGFLLVFALFGWLVTPDIQKIIWKIETNSSQVAENVSEESISEIVVEPKRASVVQTIEQKNKEDMAFKKYNYNNGNGEILEEGRTDTYRWMIRKHVQNDVLFCNGGKITMYDSYERNSRQPVGNVERNERFSISQLAYIFNVDGDEETWLKISHNGEEGWMFFRPYDIYANGKWSVMDFSELENTNWTARKLERILISLGTLEVQNRPGLTNSSVEFVIEQNRQSVVNIIAITEEKENIGTGGDDHWVKIKHVDGRTGWIHGSAVSLEKGGYKYNTPANEISFSLCLP